MRFHQKEVTPAETSQCGHFQSYGCDIWTQNDKQNPSENELKKSVNAYYQSAHSAEGKGKKNLKKDLKNILSQKKCDK